MNINIATNIFHYLNGDGSAPASGDAQGVIKQPNLHITRDKPLESADQVQSASSLDPTTWIIQQMGCMMPLPADICAMLMTEPSSHPKHDDLVNHYRSFLLGKAKKSTVTNKDEYNTFLMHWFMSEFHPIAWVRAVAKKMCGDMQGAEAGHGTPPSWRCASEYILLRQPQGYDCSFKLWT